MAARAKAKKVEAAAVIEPVEVVEGFKAFGPDLVCRAFKYEVGRTYQHKGRVRICESGFHICEMPLDCWNYYPISAPLAKVSLSGSLQRHSEDSKVVGATLTVSATVDLPTFIKAAAAWVLKAAKGNTATGDRGHAAATGDRGHAAATGDSGHAAATGDRGHAAATGYRGHAAATGDSGHAAATGDSGHAAATGKHGIAAALGPDGTATAGDTGYIVLAHWNTDSWPYKLTRVERFKVGEDGVEAGKTYRLNKSGKPEQVSA